MIWRVRCFLIVFLILARLGFSQEKSPVLEIEQDDHQLFEEHFYEALKQRAIENYDKAIEALRECQKVDSKDSPIINFELGKNYLDRKEFQLAETQFQLAVEKDQSQRWYWNGLYDVYYQSKQYKKAIPVVKKLIEFESNLKEDLVSLYVYTGQKELALDLIFEMEKVDVLSKSIEYYKLKLLKEQNSQISDDEKALKKALKDNPQEEQNYINLIVHYSKKNDEANAFRITEQLKNQFPESVWSHIGLVKFYLDNNQPDKSYQSLLKVVKSKEIGNLIKHRVFNQYLIFVSKNDQYQDRLDRAIEWLNQDQKSQINSAKEVAIFFWKKAMLDKASYYFEKAILFDKEDFETIDYALEVYSEQSKFEKVKEMAEYYLDYYPTQVRLYFRAGWALNGLKKFKKAQGFLEEALEFLVDDSSLERKIYRQLIVCYKGLNDTKKLQIYSQKLENLK